MDLPTRWTIQHFQDLHDSGCFRVICPSAYSQDKIVNIFIKMFPVSRFCHTINTHRFIPAKPQELPFQHVTVQQ
ncbi:hypothetical protein, partial [Xenorhabdus sp. IM139775]|uniref:hypothetical protein n=1 Tax=Xenorhabdus sp. IM139775 TaxID=3025876 RepID=UPI00235970EB